MTQASGEQTCFGPMRVLQAGCCTLEPQVEAHAPEMFAVLTDPAIYEFEREPPPSVERLAAGYRRLESRRSPDGGEAWLNWVVRLPTGELTGYVQASVTDRGVACVGYEFASRFWRRGLASASLRAMFAELASRYRADLAVAVLKRANYRSSGLLRKLGFAEPMASDRAAAVDHEDDEIVLQRALSVVDPAPGA